MAERDRVVRAVAADAQIRLFAATTRDLTEEARSRHNTSPVATAALGRLLTAGVMMGSMLKGDKDLLTLRLRGDGPMQGVTVTADSKGNVKGFVREPNVILKANAMGKLDVGGAIGNGFLDVIKDMGLKEPYVGQTALQTGEIAEDLTYYFANSEQTPSSVGLGVLMGKDNTVKQAGGFIVQLMPFAEESVINQLEINLGKITSVTQMLDEGNTPETILEKLSEGLGLEITDSMDANFLCNCDRERVQSALITVGCDELKSMIAEDKEIEMKCQFCNETYHFSVNELEAILSDVQKERRED